MKVTLLHDDLLKGLMTVSRVVANKGQMPVLGHVLLEASNQGLTLSTTNLELGIRYFVAGKVGEVGAMTVPAKNLTEFVSTLPPETINLESTGEKLLVKSGKFSATFAGLMASEFPVMPKTEGTNTITLAKTAVNIIAREVAFAAAMDESRPVLTAVQFRPTSEGLTVTATDGFRMSRKRMPGLVMGEGGKPVLLPARTVNELARLVSEGKKEEVNMGFVSENNQVVFGYDKIELVSRTLEGNFPDVEKIIPSEESVIVSVERAALVQGLRAVAIIARENNNILRLKISGEGILLFATAAQTGETNVLVEAEVKGEGVEIAFNYKYLLDFLASVETENVLLKFNGPLAAGVFGTDPDSHLIHLVMPVRI